MCNNINEEDYGRQVYLPPLLFKYEKIFKKIIVTLNLKNCYIGVNKRNGGECKVDKYTLQQFYERYQKEIYLYLRSLCNNPDLADDLLQETFLKALLSLPDSHTNVRAWLYMVARNLYFNYYKKEKLSTYDNEMQAVEDIGGEDILTTIINDEKKLLLYRALNKLSSVKREVLELQYFAGLSQKEIAAVLRLSPENVRVLGYRAKKDLKQYLEGNGYEI